MKCVLQNLFTTLAVIVIVAMCARIAFACSQVRKIPREALGIVPFQNEAGNIAAALAEGRGFSGVFRTGTGATAWLAPIYPLILAGTFKLFGIFTARAFFAAAFLNILFSSAACVPIFYAGKKIVGLGVASGAAWLWAVFPNAVMMPFEWIWDTSLSALLAAVILWATLVVAESRRTRNWILYGVLWGFTLLTNPALGVLLPLVLSWMAVQAPKDRGMARFAWKAVALAGCVSILCCVPWTMRNYAAFHRFVPLRSNFAFELWLGNNDIFDEQAHGGRRAITRIEEARRYTQIGEVAFMEEKWTLAKTFMETHPGLEFRLTAKRFLGFWMGTDAPLKNFLRTDSWLIRGILLCSFLTAMGAAVGMLVLWTRRVVGTFVLAVFPIVFPCVYYATHADLRYRHAIDPVVMLLTAVAIWGVFVRKSTQPAA